MEYEARNDGITVLYPGQPRSEWRGQIVSRLQNQGPRPYDPGPSARVIPWKARGPGFGETA